MTHLSPSEFLVVKALIAIFIMMAVTICGGLIIGASVLKNEVKKIQAKLDSTAMLIMQRIEQQKTHDAHVDNTIKRIEDKADERDTRGQ